MMKLASTHLEIVRKIIATHIPEFEVQAFGSRVHCESLKPFSDRDLVVMTVRPFSPAKTANLMEDFSFFDLPFKVAVVDWSSIAEGFRKIIRNRNEVIQAGPSAS